MVKPEPVSSNGLLPVSNGQMIHDHETASNASTDSSFSIDEDCLDISKIKKKFKWFEVRHIQMKNKNDDLLKSNRLIQADLNNVKKEVNQLKERNLTHGNNLVPQDVNPVTQEEPNVQNQDEAKLKEDIGTFKAMVFKLESEIKEVKAEKDAIQKQLTVREFEKIQMTKSFNNKVSEMKDIMDKLTSESESHERYQQELQKEKEIRARLEEDQKYSRQFIMCLRQMYEHQLLEVTSRNVIIEDLNNQNPNDRLDMSQFVVQDNSTEVISRLHETIDGQRNFIEDYGKTFIEKQRKIDQLEFQIMNQKKEGRKQQDIIDKAKVELRKQLNTNKDLNNLNTALKNEVAEKKSQIEALTEDLKKAKSEVESRISELTAVRTELSSLNRDHEKLTQSIQTEAQKRDMMLKEKDVTMEALKKKLSSSEAQFNSTVYGLKKQLEDLRKQIGKHHETEAKLKHEMTLKNEAFQKLADQVVTSNNQLQQVAANQAATAYDLVLVAQKDAEILRLKELVIKNNESYTRNNQHFLEEHNRKVLEFNQQLAFQEQEIMMLRQNADRAAEIHKIEVQILNEAMHRINCDHDKYKQLVEAHLLKHKVPPLETGSAADPIEVAEDEPLVPSSSQASASSELSPVKQNQLLEQRLQLKDEELLYLKRSLDEAKLATERLQAELNQKHQDILEKNQKINSLSTNSSQLYDNFETTLSNILNQPQPLPPSQPPPPPPPVEAPANPVASDHSYSSPPPKKRATDANNVITRSQSTDSHLSGSSSGVPSTADQATSPFKDSAEERQRKECITRLEVILLTKDQEIKELNERIENGKRNQKRTEDFLNSNIKERNEEIKRLHAQLKTVNQASHELKRQHEVMVRDYEVLLKHKNKYEAKLKESEAVIKGYIVSGKSNGQMEETAKSFLSSVESLTLNNKIEAINRIVADRNARINQLEKQIPSWSTKAAEKSTQTDSRKSDGRFGARKKKTGSYN